MELIVFPPTYGEPAGSPFATKALAMLELSGLNYTVRYLSNPTKMPKGKLPVLQVGDRLIADSEQIQEHLETEHGCDFDKGLTDQQKAHSRAVIRMVEEHLYFIVYSSRWMEEDHWQVTKAANFGEIPALMRGLITRIVRKGAVAQCKGQGMGRHSKAERLARFEKDIWALSTLLGDQPYLFGKTPTAADITTVAALRFTCAFTHKNDLTDCIMSYANLVDYMDRGKSDMFPT